MFGWLVGVASAAPAAGELVSSFVGPYDTYWLVGGGIAGALARALFVRDQPNWSLETLQDVFIGGVVGLLWTLEDLFPGWPPFPIPVHASEVQRAGVMAIFVCVSVAILKRLLFHLAPAYMQKLAGKAGIDLSTNNTVGGGKP